MIPLSTAISRIRTRYESEVGGSSTRWSDSKIQDFVNEGIEDLAEKTLFYERYCTVPLQEDQTWYDLRGFTPETVVRIKSIWMESRNSWLEPINPNKLDTSWESATGGPHAFWTSGIYWFAVYPKYDAEWDDDRQDGEWMRVYFAGIPSRFTSTQEVLRDLPDDYYSALYDYALYEMHAIDGNTQGALGHWREYLRRRNMLTDFADKRNFSARNNSIGGGLLVANPS